MLQFQQETHNSTVGSILHSQDGQPWFQRYQHTDGGFDCCTQCAFSSCVWIHGCPPPDEASLSTGSCCCCCCCNLLRSKRPPTRLALSVCHDRYLSRGSSPVWLDHFLSQVLSPRLAFRWDARARPGLHGWGQFVCLVTPTHHKPPLPPACCVLLCAAVMARRQARSPARPSGALLLLRAAAASGAHEVGWRCQAPLWRGLLRLPLVWVWAGAC